MEIKEKLEWLKEKLNGYLCSKKPSFEDVHLIDNAVGRRFIAIDDMIRLIDEHLRFRLERRIMQRLTERELYDEKVCFTKCSNTECSDKCAYCEVPKEARKKLKEYEDLEEKGLLMKFPCKVGDTVYMVSKVGHGHWEEDKYILDSQGDWKVHEKTFSLLLLPDIGKTVFLTPEEAEEALREMKEAGK